MQNTSFQIVQIDIPIFTLTVREETSPYLTETFDVCKTFEENCPFLRFSRFGTRCHCGVLPDDSSVGFRELETDRWIFVDKDCPIRNNTLNKLDNTPVCEQ